MGEEIVLSGMRSSGKLHLGNYLGAAVNFVKMQHDYQCFYFIADWHSLTTKNNKAELQESVKDVLANYIGVGIDPEIATIYLQSDVPEIAELYLYLNMFAHKGELEKTASFKEKIRAKGVTINAGLLTYPSLMAADILIHRAKYVPVGKDQEQHLEMTRTFANRFNRIYDTDFLPEPKAFNFGSDLVKIPGLDGGGKMSKSDNNENNAIFLTDDEATILKKFKKAKTSDSPTEKDQVIPVEINNLFSIMEHVSKPETVQQFKDSYKDCSIRYGDLKMQLAKDTNEFLKPIRERITDLRANEKFLKEVAELGKEKARKSAKETLDGVREIMGFQYFK
ncbi:MAG: tryptophan--tRNA ligase [Chitinophagales bacterium]|jgi:tryptophanyl-tRNA synthetase|nr:tryptophan--tRNA ligase [Chitinophagales bacterium]